MHFVELGERRQNSGDGYFKRRNLLVFQFDWHFLKTRNSFPVEARSHPPPPPPIKKKKKQAKKKKRSPQGI